MLDFFVRIVIWMGVFILIMNNWINVLLWLFVKFLNIVCGVVVLRKIDIGIFLFVFFVELVIVWVLIK